VQIAIIAGGLATRLLPLTEKIAKSMIMVGGKPFLEHQVEVLKSAGIGDLVLCVGHLAGQIEEHFGDGRAYGVRIRYSDEGGQLMGTAGAIKKAAPLLDEKFFMMDGDSYLPSDYRAAMAHFDSTNKMALMVVFRNNDLYETSNAVVDGDLVTMYSRRRKVPGMVFVHTGLSILRKTALDLIPADRVVMQDELWTQLASRNELMAFETQSRFYEVGSFSGLEDFRRMIERQRNN
jgi:NDP-sugar pyrophosphorylase family protein